MVVDDGLRRKSTGLSPSHVELIRLLAGIAVDEFLAEAERVDGAEQAVHVVEQAGAVTKT